MESQSYPNSGESSPLSREIDCDNSPSWNDSSANYKVKFICSYGGKIQPRPHDNQLSYVGGDTKILALDRNSKFSAVVAKLSLLCDSAASVFCFKYQLPGEDLDALISVTNDEDLEHMMVEYDRLTRSSLKPARLRIFLFPLNRKPNSQAYEFKKPTDEENWFIDALNPVQFHTETVISEAANPDFLFGFDKATNYKVSDHSPNSPNLKTESNEAVTAFEKLQMDAKPNGNSPKEDETDFYKVREKAAPLTMPTPHYWPEMPISVGNYQVSGCNPMDQPPIYVMQNLPGIYHQNPSVRPETVSLPPGQGYYYCEQPMYNAVPSPMIQRPKLATMQRMPEQGYKLCYDYAGRPLYYAVPVGGLAPNQAQQTQANVVDVRDGEVVSGKLPQTSSV